MNQSEIIKLHDEHVMHTYNRYQIAPVEGKGSSCTDADDRKYIDFSSGIGTSSLGWCNPEWSAAVSNQTMTLGHVSNYYYNEPSTVFAEKLIGATGYKKVFFGNSGAEANECCIKTARKYSFDKYSGGDKNYSRNVIITLENSFHGRTIATLSATGQEIFHNYFFPFVPGFKTVPPNDIDALKAAVTDEVCAIMFEPLMGEGGIIPLEKDFVDAIFSIAAKNDLITIADEVQCGAGRTGKFLCLEHFGHKADLTSMAKGIGGGLPIGLCLFGEKCSDTLSAGTHGTTFGGNPIVCAGANVVLDRLLSPGFLDDVAKKGDYIKQKLLSFSKVTSVDGLGLMMGVNLDGITVSEVVNKSLEQGLLCITAKDKLRLLPPLTITREDIDSGLEILSEILN